MLDTDSSIHNSEWPQVQERLIDDDAEAVGRMLIEIATSVRRYKSESNLSLGAELARLHLTTADPESEIRLREAALDIVSVTRAREVTVNAHDDPALIRIGGSDGLGILLVP